MTDEIRKVNNLAELERAKLKKVRFVTDHFGERVAIYQGYQQTGSREDRTEAVFALTEEETGLPHLVATIPQELGFKEGKVISGYYKSIPAYKTRAEWR